MYWLYWLFILILLAAAGGAALLAYRTYVLGDTSAPKLNIGGWLFRQRPEPRLGVIEQASVDADYARVRKVAGGIHTVVGGVGGAIANGTPAIGRRVQHGEHREGNRRQDEVSRLELDHVTLLSLS